MEPTKMKYDIRNSENARQTLISLTGVSLPIWKQYVERESEFEYIEDLVEYVASNYGKIPKDYRDIYFIYFHITTSANNCASFQKHGILDLPHSYMCPDSELRSFLDKHNVYIDLNNELLRYGGKKFDIHYDPCPIENSIKYDCWLIGRKFYYDFTICGFLSASDIRSYGGNVHDRPEILMDIDRLLQTKFSEEWASTHIAYKVVAQVKGSDILGEDDIDEKDKVMHYLTDAYYTAFGGPDEKILLMQNGVCVPPTNILEIKPLACWKKR